MNRRVNYKTLWLVSERDESARKQSFGNRTLLFGKNGTGKSRIIKNLYWAFGCNVRERNAGVWDPTTIAGVEFSFRDSEYLVLRDGKRLGMFDADNRLLFSSDNVSAWERALGDFFGFKLQLRRPGHGSFSQAGPDYMFLPFYMDQDGSWGAEWESFDNLSQFSGWEATTFEAFIGLRPHAYFEAKHKSKEVGAQLTERRNELEAQRLAFKRVQDVLPKNLPSLNVHAFRTELTDLGRKALRLQQEQVRLRGQLLGVVNTRQKVSSELKVAQDAYKELRGDFAYLTERQGKQIECPTCGTVHENSFHARLQLTEDAESLAGLISELRMQADECAGKEASLRTNLRTIEKHVAELESLQIERRARLRLEDVLASQSKKTLDTAFHRVTTDLGAVIRRLEEAKAVADALVKKYEDRDRQKKVLAFYADEVRSLSNLLNVPSDEQIPEPRPGSRAKTGGSSRPRSLLAVHLSLLATNSEWGESPMFPFVVDTPQQSGQDDENLGKMIGTLGNAAGTNHQVILAAERLPEGVDLGSFETVGFPEKRSAMSKDSYTTVVARLKGPIAALREQLRPRVSA
jgi:hypothetical protein